MKKLLILFITMISAPLIVFADTAGPELISYEAIVSKEDGISYYKYNCVEKKCELEEVGKIDAGTKIKIVEEIYFNDELVSVISDEDSNKELRNYYVKTDEINAVKNIGEYEYYEYDGDETKELLVITNDSYLYKGPAFGFEKQNEKTIKKGETIKITKTDGYNWYYAETLIGKGWVYYGYDTPNFAEKEDSEFVLVENYTSMLKEPIEGSAKINISIPKGTELKSDYYKYIDNTYYRVNYNGTVGWISGEKVVFKNEKKRVVYVNKESITLYKDYKNFGSRANVEVKANTMYEIDYGEYNWYRIKVGETYYWFYTDKENSVQDGIKKYGAFLMEYKGRYKTDTDTDVYDITDFKKTIGKMEKEKPFECYVPDGEYYYVFCKDAGIAVERSLILVEASEVYKPVKKEEPVKKEKKLSSMEIAIYAISGAVVLTLTTIVIIVLVNKKKKKKIIKDETSIVDIIEDNKKEIEKESKKKTK